MRPPQRNDGLSENFTAQLDVLVGQEAAQEQTGVCVNDLVQMYKWGMTSTCS